jgi:hypothetical protein
VLRWENFTGKKAQQLEGSDTHEKTPASGAGVREGVRR